MSGQEGSKTGTGLGLLFGELIAKLYEVLEQFNNKVASGQQNPQAVRAGSLLIAKTFTVYGMLKLASFLVPGCAKSITEAIDAIENSLKSISNNLAQDQPDITKVGEELEILGTNETVLINDLRTCVLSGKQA